MALSVRPLPKVMALTPVLVVGVRSLTVGKVVAKNCGFWGTPLSTVTAVCGVEGIPYKTRGVISIKEQCQKRTFFTTV